MRYFLIAGEASGDLHASLLMRSLQKTDPDAQFLCLGGDAMQAAGGVLIRHYKSLAYMGFVPVLLHLHSIVGAMRSCCRALRDFHPDAVILVDYPGVNIRMAKYAKTRLSGSLPVIYYISPKLWAWKEYRIHSVRKYVDRMLCILPFEPEFYARRRYYGAIYAGNPTVDEIASRAFASETFEAFTEANGLDRRPIVALLAGSRKQEIRDNLPAMLEASSAYGDYQWVIAGAPGIDAAYYRPFIENRPVGIVFGQTYRLLQQSRAALVTSGTATLETALLRVPQAVCYRLPLAGFGSFVFRRFFSCEYISLVNLIAGKSVLKELFGGSFSVQQIRNELDRLLNDQAYCQQMQEGYQEVIDRLGPPGASETAAREIKSCIRDCKGK
jgi:lipid-A-disaccharide synthase